MFCWNADNWEFVVDIPSGSCSVNAANCKADFASRVAVAVKVSSVPTLSGASSVIE